MDTEDIETYILTVYKLFIDKHEHNHFVSHFKKCETPLHDTSETYIFLKEQPKHCIKNIIRNHSRTLYDTIVKNGGYENWNIVEMCRCVCYSISEAKVIANSQIDIAKRNVGKLYKYQCDSCNYSCDIESKWIRHQIGKTHTGKIGRDTKKSYVCTLCKTVYLSRTSLWKHTKECTKTICLPRNLTHHFIEVDKPYVSIQNEVMEIIQQNQLLIAQNTEFKELLMEQHTKMLELSRQPTTVVNNNNNFNLNFFLNEICKDAMSLTQFVNSLQINTETLEYTGVHGYVAGISKIFMDGLRQLEVNMRPIHCTDLKRETLYIKENDVWEKDNPEKSKFTKALNTIVHKNMQQVREWVKQNPKCDIIDSDEYQLHIDIMKQCVGGDSEYTNNRKILRNVAKEVLIDKNGKNPENL